MSDLRKKIHQVAIAHSDCTVWGAEHVDGRARVLVLPRHRWRTEDVLHIVWLARPPLARE